MVRENNWVRFVRIIAYIMLVAGVISSIVISYQLGVAFGGSSTNWGVVFGTLLATTPLAFIVPAVVIIFLDTVVEVATIRLILDGSLEVNAGTRVEAKKCLDCNKECKGIFNVCPNCGSKNLKSTH